ncbi:MAG TPA: leucine--tRNA ligase [Gammaproteobacteria bacterium]|nr:leucine--tRNA ligase [Gammaproteobacteria bacterium]
MQEQYNPQQIEKTSQAYWDNHKSFNAHENTSKEKFYCLSMFPYPSGWLHMGHVRNYTIGDVIARYQYMLGKNVLQPMGWDAFGLPAENAAIKHKIPPAEWTYKNIEHMRSQLKSLGLAVDWEKEIATCNPKYYRFEQWFFLQLYKKGLVYKKNAEVNWDPVDQTILANEQVVDGRGWRSGALVERREIPQWFFKITAYADELLNDLEKLPHWPEQVKTMQRNWIGRSEGVEIQFSIIDNDEHLAIFTTRPDTLFGVTYIAIAPQHPLAKKAAEKNPELEKFLEECRTIKVAEADLATMEKRGIETHFKARHPITRQELPVWVANFVVMDYGSGAVMAVPAHDQRDFEFAEQYHLPIKQVIHPADQSVFNFTKAFTQAGILMDSGKFSGLDSKTASTQIIDDIEKQKLGTRKINFRLRDWSVARQRYWGAPIPMINCTACGTVPVLEKDLPVLLPEKISFSGVISPLKSMPEFLKTTCPQCGKPALRETDTFDTFFESSWYYARFTCKDQEKSMLDERAKYWTPVDQYIGGIEHAVMHLLYARFIHKAMRDEGLLNCDEPFVRLLTQGMVLNQGIKMSKSKGNTVDPEPLINRYGADTVRLFIIFASPPEQNLEWSDSGVEGAHRFLKRLWAFAYENRELIISENKKSGSHTDLENAHHEQRDLFRQIYEILEQAQYDYDRLQFNTVVSGCMKLFNLLTKIPAVDNEKIDIRPYIIQQGMSILLRLLAPIAPHISHELWQELKFGDALINASWPKSDSAARKVNQINLVVQINGKLRANITVPRDADTKTIETIATADAKVQQSIADKSIKKIITVPGRLINIVTGDK